MSLFALAMVGFVFGWGLCKFFSIVERPTSIRILFDHTSPRGEDYIAKLKLRRKLRRFALDNENSSLGQIRLKIIQYWYWLFIFLAVIFLITVEILQDLHSERGAEIEDFVTDPRVSVLCVSAVVGFAARLNRRQISLGFDTLAKIALVGGAPAKEKIGGQGKGSDKSKSGRNTDINYVDAKFPWYIEVRILLSLVVVVVIWFNPQLFKNLTSLKAGSVEAHFATATANATVQSGLIVAVDPARKRTTAAWASFEFPKKGHTRAITYAAEDLSGIDKASCFFTTYLLPVFKYRNDLYDKRLPLTSRISQQMINIANDLSTLVRYKKLEFDSRDAEKSPITSFSELCQSILCAEPTDHCRFTEGSDLEMLMEQDIDPYLIQAVGDLQFVLGKRREQEDFIVAASSGFEGGENLCPDGCKTAPT